MNRKQLYAWLVQAPACIIAMEACAGAHWLARKCRSFGHQTRLIAPQFVRPFVNGKQETRRCASHLRSRLTPVDALCRAQDARTTGAARAASGACSAQIQVAKTRLTIHFLAARRQRNVGAAPHRGNA